MSTPIENNTEELQEILQTVNNLPNLGGSEYDLELIADMPDEIQFVSGLSAEHITVNGNYETLNAKIMSGKGIKAVLRHSYDNGQFVYQNTLSAFSAGFNNAGDFDAVFADFLICAGPGFALGFNYIVHVKLKADNSIVVELEAFKTERGDTA